MRLSGPSDAGATYDIGEHPVNDKPTNEARGAASADETAPVTPGAGTAAGGAAPAHPSAPVTNEAAAKEGWRSRLRTRVAGASLALVAVAIALFLGGGLAGYGVASAVSDDRGDRGDRGGPGHARFDRDGERPHPGGRPGR